MPLIVTDNHNSKSVLEPWLAVNLSMFFSGIGQLYAGKKIKGWGLICCQTVLIAIAIWSIFSPNGNTVTGLTCLFLVIIIYFFSLFDAYNCVKEQLNERVSEKIPRINKDPWFAVFLSRILPGLGHLYIEKAIIAAVFLSLFIIFSSLTKILSNLLLFTPIISAIACYHAFISFPNHRRKGQQLMMIIAAFILAFGVVGGYLPSWVQQKIDLFDIPSESMLPTLQVGDKVFVNKADSYSPKLGDLVVFKEPKSAIVLQSEADKKKQRFFIKRVIGEPGQIVRVSDKLVYINDQPLQENYLAETPVYQWGPEQVPAQSYFVLGDNRNNSFDSHVWGFLPKDLIVGRAYKIYLPPARIQSLLNHN